MRIFNIQRFSLHDGEGIRTVVFFKGCNLRCFWCHNPEGQRAEKELFFIASKCAGCGACEKVCPKKGGAIFTDNCTLCGKCAEVCYFGARESVGEDITAEELINRLLKDEKVFLSSGGGVTFSGGEALLQEDELFKVAAMLKERGIDTALETAASVGINTIKKAVRFIDRIFCDLKAVTEQLHISGTGRKNADILENIKYLSENCKNLTLRIPVIPGFNDKEEVQVMAEFIKRLPIIPEVELLAFHGDCIGKYKALNRKYLAEGIKNLSKDGLKEVAKEMQNYGITCKY